MTIKELAKAFSNGEFSKTYQNIASDAKWAIIGEQVFENKQAIIQNCDQVSEYFKTITTKFKTDKIIEDGNTIAVIGTAEFIIESKTTSNISACDIYEFNNNDEIQNITSYCIQT